MDVRSGNPSNLKIQVASRASFRQLEARTGRLQECDRRIKIIQCHENAVCLRPSSHSLVGCVCPRQDFDPPSPFVHTFQSTVKSSAFVVSGAIARQLDHDSRVSIEVQCVFQHAQLQQAIRHFPLSLLCGAPVEKVNLDPMAFHAIPQLAHFGRQGARGHGFLNGPVGMRQPEQILEMSTDAISGVWPLFLFFSQTLRLVEDVRVIPIDQNFFHGWIASASFARAHSSIMAKAHRNHPLPRECRLPPLARGADPSSWIYIRL